VRLRQVQAGELRERLGLTVDAEGVPLQVSLEHLLRLTIHRWRLAERREVLRSVRRQLEACDCDGAEARERLDEAERRLLLLADLEEVTVNGARSLAATEARWVRLGEGVAALTGTLPGLPAGLVPLPLPESPSPAHVRRFDPRAPEAATALRRAGVREASLHEWLGPPEPERITRALGEPSDPEFGVRQLWEAGLRQLAHDGSSTQDATAYRILRGPPGGLFGNGRGAEPSGRWGAAEEDGTWCALRRGYSDEHWHPALLSVQGGAPHRALDLPGHDALNWLVLARGLALGAPEEVRLAPGLVRLTFRPPAQLERVLELLGERTGSWEWHVPPGTERAWDVWGLLDSAPLHETEG
jgi:hypothetical protein